MGTRWAVWLTLIPVCSVVAQYGGGTGTVQDPYQIHTAEQFNTIGLHQEDWDKHFILLADLDLSEIEPEPFHPIGNYTSWNPDSVPFTGFFDGQGHEIQLYFSNETLYFEGLFTGLGAEGELCNIRVSSPKPDFYEFYGTLSRYILEDGIIRNCIIDIVDTGNQTFAVGIGVENHGTIIGCTVYINGWGLGAAGVVYRNYGTIVDCHSSGTLSGGGDFGGLIGTNTGIILRCSSDITVSGSPATGSDGVGGLVGDNQGTIRECVFLGSIDREYNFHPVGGIAGRNRGIIGACSVFGQMSIDKEEVGGVAGINLGSIYNCYCMSNITIDCEWGNCTVGGLVGYNFSQGLIWNSYMAGTLEGTDNPRVLGGTLVGHQGGGMSNCLWDITKIPEIDGVGEDVGMTSSVFGISSSQMRWKETFTSLGWDFLGESANGTEDYWRMCFDNMDYPRLAWESAKTGDLDCPDGVEILDLCYLAQRWLATEATLSGYADIDQSGRVDNGDLAVLSRFWQETNPNYLVNYKVGACSSEMSEPPVVSDVPFQVEVQGHFIHFYDRIGANCCTPGIEMEVQMEGKEITIHETELPGGTCRCYCTYPLRAKVGPLASDTYTLAVIGHSEWGECLRGITEFTID